MSAPEQVLDLGAQAGDETIGGEPLDVPHDGLGVPLVVEVGDDGGPDRDAGQDPADPGTRC